MIEKLKQRWRVNSTREVIIILVVFSLAGTSILLIKKPVYRFFHIPLDASLWIKIPMALLFYQVLLLFFGALLGQFRFFWEKEKKLFRWIFKPLLPKPKTEP
jgi:hypothetical protein